MIQSASIQRKAVDCQLKLEKKGSWTVQKTHHVTFCSIVHVVLERQLTVVRQALLDICKTLIYFSIACVRMLCYAMVWEILLTFDILPLCHLFCLQRFCWHLIFGHCATYSAYRAIFSILTSRKQILPIVYFNFCFSIFQSALM